MHQKETDPRKRTAILAAASALLVALSLGVGAVAADETLNGPACVESECGNTCQNWVYATRRHTAKYLRESVALAEGFVADPFCIAVPGVGGMGIHYPNFDRMSDLEVDARFPELLLYAERPDGGRYLVAVEYFAPVLSDGNPWFGSATEPPPTVDNPPPVLFGQTFDGPMPGHAPGMPWHYDLHAWIWKENPAGLFAQFNPRVQCR